MNLDHLLTPYIKINSKWMKSLNVRQEMIKILQEKAGKNLFDLGHSNILLNTCPEARETKAKMNYWDFIQIKSFCTAKETSAKLKGNQHNGRRYMQMTYQLASKSMKNLTNSPKKQTIQWRNRQKT